MLNFAETQCVASRAYATAPDMMTLAIRPSPNGQIYELILLRNMRGSRDAREVPATVTIGERQPIATKMLVYKAGKDAPRIARGSLPAVAAHDLREARSLTIAPKGEAPVTLALSGTGPLMKEMDRCLLSLQDDWNISPYRFSALRAPAQGSIQGVLRSGDYPSDAIDGNAEGTVAVQLLIDDKGRVADCMLIQTSGNALLDTQSCVRIRERATYVPAVGADGKPTRSATVGRITWRIASY